MATSVDSAWYHVVRPAWLEILRLPFADHDVLERCRAESLLTEEQFRICSQEAFHRNRLLLVYLMTNGVLLTTFLDVLLRTSTSCKLKVAKKLAEELNKDISNIGSPVEHAQGEAAEWIRIAIGDSAEASSAVSTVKSGGGWQSEVIKQSAKHLEAIFEADCPQLLLQLRFQVVCGGISDQAYTEMSKVVIPGKVAKLFVSQLIKSELAAGICLAGLSRNAGLLEQVELNSGLVATSTRLKHLHELMQPFDLMYSDEKELSDQFFEQIIPAIAPCWRHVAKMFGTLSEGEIEFIEKTSAVPFAQTHQMLQAAREKCRTQDTQFSIVYLKDALQRAGLNKEADDTQQAFSAGMAIRQGLVQAAAETFQQMQAELFKSLGKQEGATPEKTEPGMKEQKEGLQGLLQAIGLQAEISIPMNNIYKNFQGTKASGQPGTEQPLLEVQLGNLPDLQEFARAFQSAQPASTEHSKFELGRKDEMNRKGMSEETWQSYQEALKGGKRTVLHERVIICGAGRVGKTSFRRSLFGEKFEEVMDSTIGVELHKVVCTAQRDGKTNEWTWSEMKSEDEHQILRTTKALREEVFATKQHEKMSDLKLPSSSTTQQHMKQSVSQQSAPVPTTTGSRSQSVAISSEQPTSVSSSPRQQNLPCGSMATGQSCSNPSSPPSNERSIDPMLVARFRNKISGQVRQLLENIRHNPEKLDLLKAADNLCFVDVWDFAGQEAFVVIQHMLLAELRCAYVAMFNSKLPLNQHSNQHICQDGKEHEIVSDPDVTNFDILESWLNVIQQVVGNNPDVPVYVVGSHADQLEDEEQGKIVDYLWCNINGKAYSRNVDDIVFVDNTLSGSSKIDDGVRKLKTLLIEKMLQQEAMQLPIPISWLPFTHVARLLAKETGLPWLSMDEVKLVADEVCDMSSSADISNLLQFHHALGQILHYPHNPNLSGRAIINVEWLLGVVSRLFIPQPPGNQDKRFRTHYSLLRDRGILLESLAQHIWEQDPATAEHTKEPEHRHFLFHLMEEFSLLYDTNDQRSFDGLPLSHFFYVPALVMRVPESSHTASKDDVEESPPLILYSGKNHLFPQSLFWCLVVCSMRQYSPSRDPILHQSSARIACFRSFWLVLRYFQHGIKVTVEREKQAKPVCGAEDLSLKGVCRRLLPFLESQLNKLKGDTLKHFEWQLTVRCPCSFNKDPCVKHSQPNCPQISCHHFVILQDNISRAPYCSHPQGLQHAQDVSATTEIWPCLPAQDHPRLGSSQDGVLATTRSTSTEFTSMDGHFRAATDCVGNTTSAASERSEQVVGIHFTKLPDVGRARIFNAIAKEFATHRSTIISLLLGSEGNDELNLKRSSTVSGHSERDLLFEGLRKWFEQSENPTGRVLYDAMIDAGCPEGLLAKYKELFELPLSYSGGFLLFSS